MCRVLVFLTGLLLILLITERRLSDGDTQMHMTGDSLQALWDPVQHPSSPSDRPLEPARKSDVTAGVHATPALNCSMVMSVDKSSPYSFTSIDDGVRFDIDGDGDLDQVSWTAAGSDVAFLALDSDGDRRITSGKELIGEHTRPGVGCGPAVLIALSNDALGGDRRALLDSENPLFFTLLLWTDTNHNGISERAELRSAHRVVSDIGLGFWVQHRRDRHGNQSRYGGFLHVRMEAGLNTVTSTEERIALRRWLYDVCLVTREADRSRAR